MYAVHVCIKMWSFLIKGAGNNFYYLGIVNGGRLGLVDEIRLVWPFLTNGTSRSSFHLQFTSDSFRNFVSSGSLGWYFERTRLSPLSAAFGKAWESIVPGLFVGVGGFISLKVLVGVRELFGDNYEGWVWSDNNDKFQNLLGSVQRIPLIDLTSSKTSPYRCHS